MQYHRHSVIPLIMERRFKDKRFNICKDMEIKITIEVIWYHWIKHHNYLGALFAD